MYKNDNTMLVPSSVKQSILQDIVPFDCVDTVRELFVPGHKVDELRQEAETLPQLEVTKLDTQWIQVRNFHNTLIFSGLYIVLLFFHLLIKFACQLSSLIIFFKNFIL